MTIASIKKPVILGIRFFLPVIFLLFLYPSTHNYNSLDIVQDNVNDITSLLPNEKRDFDFDENISVLIFLGNKPMSKAIAALNLKELVYDKFKGFKRFQIIALVGEDSAAEVALLKKDLYQYDQLDYWHFVPASALQTKNIFNGLLSVSELDDDLSFEEVFIIDKELKQRGRIDDRTENEIKKGSQIYGLYSYNCIEVAELKNKMSEDIRILFTEYRQKRKGIYDSSDRRSEDINADEKN